METKIPRFIIVLVFILSAVNCNVEASDTNSSADCSICPDLHIYTAEEQQQVLQNLLGRYRNTLNNQVTTLDIRSVIDVTQIGVVGLFNKRCRKNLTSLHCFF